MYECKTTFIDDNGTVHQYGKIISNETFNKLTSQQQRKYKIRELEAA